MSEWPAIEYEDGYPVDEDFTELASLPPDWEKAGEWLLRELPRACEFMSCSYEIRRGESIMGKACTHLHFSTGGWSGAESIIAFIESRFDTNYLMLQWRRGGHYIFELPPRICEPPPE